MKSYTYFNRDLSWLSFNARVLQEAAKPGVPILERIRFLSIYSSNLDEFYRVRIPALLALHKLYDKDNIKARQKKEYADVIVQVQHTINQQLENFGTLLTTDILPELKKHGIHLVYNEPLPPSVCPCALDYFYSDILAFLQPVPLKPGASTFFPENNKLYLAVITQAEPENEQALIINIPSDQLPRFYRVEADQKQYLIFLDDIIKTFIPHVLPQLQVKACYSFKITRNAEMDLEDEYDGDIAEKIEKQVLKRDYGLATRFLYDPRMPLPWSEAIIVGSGVTHANIVQGGIYHNLRDLGTLPLHQHELSYPPLPVKESTCEDTSSLLDQLEINDILVHTPYQSYTKVLRFFNEAAIDASVTEIAVTLYRVARNSRIVNALINAAKSGKKVTVFIELKARFDEVNNLKWSKRMKEAGIKIIYSIPNLKVHAKIALVKRVKGTLTSYVGLLATGNLNENTSRFYTDHILLTSRQPLVQEMEQLFQFLSKREQPANEPQILFQHLLVARFNLQERFLQLIDREIEHAKNGLPARITIKLNNLEERVLIKKLYEASCAGVQVHMIVRSVCCLIPGIPGMSENITVKRIVDRYLEHGRIFIFHNNGQDDIYMGSADWMNRNIYRRIEVCFPIYQEDMKQEMLHLIQLQWQDNVQAVQIDGTLQNVPIPVTENLVQSQLAIHRFLNGDAALPEA